MISNKRGKLYFRLVLALALLAAAVFAYSAFAAVPSSTPVITNTNGTLLGSTQIANASIVRAKDQLFGSSNFSSENASFASLEENSTFKWLKRSLYLPQNLRDENANDYVMVEL